MRSLLGCLLCLVFGTSQSFALKGGPNFGSSVRTTGIYAGVLIPGPLSPGTNSIGLFSATIPRSGLGTGTVVLFAAGLTFAGTFQGIADPDSGKLLGQFDATSTVTIGVSGGTTTGAVEVAAGKLDGRIVANRNLLSSAKARIIGTSNIQYSRTANNPFLQIAYIVAGFKQQDV